MSILGLSTRSLTAVLLVGGLVAAPTGPANAKPQDADRARQLPNRIHLPDGFRPEGIATNKSGTAYLGSLADGDIYAANLRTGRGHRISQGNGTPAVGVKLAGRALWAAGGPDGDAKVVNVRTGKVVAHYDFTDATSFVNDVVLWRGSAWFTDSQRPVLYKVTPRRGQGLSSARVRTLRLRGAWEQVPNEFNANGISTTPNGRALLVVQSATGRLFRVNPQTGRAVRVRLGYQLTNGDGMLREGRTLFVAQNQDNKVAVLRLRKGGWSGHFVRALRRPSFDVPTTIARYGSSLYLPNARFSSPTATKYWITRVRP